MDVIACDRCESKIAEQPYDQTEPLYVSRKLEDGSYDHKQVRLCSLCWEELWDWTGGADAPDRSHLTDPEPIDKMAESVERHINELSGVLSDLEDAKPDMGVENNDR